jgi:hypothetical protein
VLKSSVPSSSVLVGRSVPVVPDRKPVLSEKWLVIVYVSVKFKRDLSGLVNVLDRSDVVIVTHVGDGSVQAYLSSVGIAFSVRDSRETSVEKMIRWTEKQLGVGEISAKVIVNRSGRYEPTIVRNVEMLRVVDKNLLVTRNLAKYLPQKKTVSFVYFYKFLVFGVGKYADIVSLVRQYQFSLTTLVKYVLDRIEFDIQVYKMIMDSEFTRDTCLEMAERINKPVGVLLECLRMFDVVSIERLYTIKVLVGSVRGKTPTEFLYKIRGVVSERKV